MAATAKSSVLANARRLPYRGGRHVQRPRRERLSGQSYGGHWSMRDPVPREPSARSAREGATGWYWTAPRVADRYPSPPATSSRVQDLPGWRRRRPLLSERLDHRQEAGWRAGFSWVLFCRLATTCLSLWPSSLSTPWQERSWQRADGALADFACQAWVACPLLRCWRLGGGGFGFVVGFFRSGLFWWCLGRNVGSAAPLVAGFESVVVFAAVFLARWCWFFLGAAAHWWAQQNIRPALGGGLNGTKLSLPCRKAVPRRAQHRTVALVVRHPPRNARPGGARRW